MQAGNTVRVDIPLSAVALAIANVLGAMVLITVFLYYFSTSITKSSSPLSPTSPSFHQSSQW